ncbi:MAG TPA: M28 family peptidase [Isosphaeraceae bacterium]|nr:M28 family peptidase [Isosphaeraceae bacterium]
MLEKGWLAWLGIVLALAVSWLSIDAQKPPPAVPADAPAEVFSAARAIKHVEAIAREPHPTGSPEAERVRKVLVKKLEELGLSPEIQMPVDLDAPERNVLARLKGRGSSGKKALMLCAHYDSVPSGPGAGDDASGVAVVLETLRAVKAGPPPDRDVIALLDDGEEKGLLGASLFVDEHPWAKEVGVVLNFDSRGNSGPSFMFETSDGNGWLIHQFAQGTPHPLATSLSMDIYRIMPNNTDMTIFKGAGKGGLNYAFGGGFGYYHTAEDTPANLKLSTLQHHGENALAMTRRLGGLDLDHTKRDDVVYTSILSRFVLSYPRSWAWPLAQAAALLSIVVVGVSLGKGRVRLVDLAAGAGIWLFAAWASILAAGTFWLVLREVLSNVGVRWWMLDLPLMAVCALIAAGVTLGVERLSAHRRSLLALSLGALFWWLAAALATAQWLPGASYLFVWPTLFGLLGLGVAILSRVGSTTAWVAIVLCSVPVLVVMPPLMYNTFEGLGLRLAAPTMILVTLFLGAILPLLGPIVMPDPRARNLS